MTSEGGRESQIAREDGERVEEEGGEGIDEEVN